MSVIYITTPPPPRHRWHLFCFHFRFVARNSNYMSRHLLSKFSIIFESDEAGKEEEEEEEEEGEERIKSTKIQNVGVAP